MTTMGRLDRWTRYFTVGSGVGLVASVLVQLAGFGRIPVALVGVFGFVCPMVFGMAYLLLPSYVGRTLVDQRIPGVHFACAFGGATLFVAGLFVDQPWLETVGAAGWSVGVVLFVGSLVWTVLPAVLDQPQRVLRADDRPQRSTRLGTVTIPVGVGYLLVGTLALTGRVDLLPSPLTAGLPAIVHYHAAGFAALLVFALGVRLLTGFFHVSPRYWLAWLVLTTGSVGPGLLAANFGGGPWFRVGAALEATALVGYAVLVGDVASRTSWNRVGLSGILLGSIAGAAAAVAALAAVFYRPSVSLAAHTTLILNGFFPLTIAGYAVQFFGIPAGAFYGADDRTVLLSFVCLATGTTIRTAGVLLSVPVGRRFGSLLVLAGAATYLYLLMRRLLGP